jgi:hypothetical protein
MQEKSFGLTHEMSGGGEGKPFLLSLPSTSWKGTSRVKAMNSLHFQPSRKQQKIPNKPLLVSYCCYNKLPQN